MSGAAPKQAMAAKAKKPQQPKQKKKQPKQLSKPLQKEVKKVEKKVRRLTKRTAGPKANDKMTTTVTLGVLQGQTAADLSRQLRIPLNPLLAKFADGKSTTPLSIRASMYEMWKIVSCEITATPLSGYSNVCGSVGFLSLTLNGLEAGADSIDTIKARIHRQMALGRLHRLKIPARALEGPREGWWLVDTSASPADAYGPAIDGLVAYKTENLLSTASGSTSNYTGPLWQLEMKATYLFSTYHPKPGLQSLVSDTLSQPAQVTVATDTNGALIMTTTDVRLLRILTPRATGQKGGKSQTVWAVAGAAVDAAATVLGPWGWLLKGGFWLVRKIFGASANGTTSFQIYPSITAAMEDQPIYGGSGTSSISLPVVHVAEVMNPNPESNDLNQQYAAAQPASTTQVPLVELTGQTGLPALYTYREGRYTPAPNWSGSTVILTGVPRYRVVSGGSEQFGVDTNNMSKAACTKLQIYDFTDFGVFFGHGSFLTQGAVHTSKTLLTALTTGGVTRPWLAAEASGVNWALPSWAGYPVPALGDYYLQMQNITDSTTHTTPVGVYFVVAYHTQQKVVAFWNNGSGEQAAPTSLMCLYNVDAGRDPVALTNFVINETEHEGFSPEDEDDDDDISLADSFLCDDHSECIAAIEMERESLKQRLIELEKRRFALGN
uniref:Structural protein n=1 Tax=Neva virus TaxID=2776960 RepID=A0A8E4VR32_9VIRU|nr:MAG: structural protein [Neva virus]